MIAPFSRACAIRAAFLACEIIPARPRAEDQRNRSADYVRPPALSESWSLSFLARVSRSGPGSLDPLSSLSLLI